MKRFYQKAPAARSQRKKTLSFALGAEEKSGTLACRTVDFALKGGKAIGGFGAEEAFDEMFLDGSLVDGLALLFVEREDKKVLLLAEREGSYVFRTATGEYYDNIMEDSLGKVEAVVSYTREGGEEGCVLCCENGRYVYEKVEEYDRLCYQSDLPPFKSGCYSFERLVLLSAEAAHPFRVYFFKPIASVSTRTGYGGAGYVDLDGGLGDTFGAFAGGKEVWILRKNGVTVLDVRGENYRFTALPMPVATGRIYPSSGVLVGDKLYFAGENGIGYFDGNHFALVETSLIPYAEYADGTGLAVFGKYYGLALSDGTVFFDTQEKSGYVSAIRMEDATSDGKECYFRADGKICRLTRESRYLGEGLPKRLTASTDFSLGAGQKTLSALALQGKGTIGLSIKSEKSGEERKYSLTLGKGARVYPRLCGETFALSVGSDDPDCEIAGISVALAYGKEGSI